MSTFRKRVNKSYSVFGAGFYSSAGDLAFFWAQVLNKARAQKAFSNYYLLHQQRKTDIQQQVGILKLALGGV